MGEFSGKRVLVTGASGGLGAGMAKAFAREGADVVVHYFQREQGAQDTLDMVLAHSEKSVKIRADLRSENAIHRLINASVEALGGLDIVVNNAGVVLKASLGDTSTTHWDDTLNINLRAPFILSKLASKQMRVQGHGGVIIHNTSIHGFASCENFSAYASSKAALEALAKVQALEWANDAIRVNCIAPGVVPVERTEKVLRTQGAQDLWMPHIPVGRFGEIEDIAEATLFMCSDKASWMTGQSIICDGGTLARMNVPQRTNFKKPPLPSPVEEL